MTNAKDGWSDGWNPVLDSIKPKVATVVGSSKGSGFTLDISKLTPLEQKLSALKLDHIKRLYYAAALVGNPYWYVDGVVTPKSKIPREHMVNVCRDALEFVDIGWQQYRQMRT